MKEIKDVTKEVEDKAYGNVEGFDFTKLCFKTIFNMLNDDGVFKMLFEELLPIKVKRKSQIELKTFKYIVVKGEDGKVYPAADWIIVLKDDIMQENLDFCLTLSPFAASISNALKSYSFEECDEKLTKIWCAVMRGLFRDKWEAAFEKYSSNAEKLKESKIQTKLKIEQEYQDGIDSI